MEKIELEREKEKLKKTIKIIFIKLTRIKNTYIIYRKRE